MESQEVFSKKNVLVIGGAGFIGSHLCDKLIKNFNVICLDNFITSSSENINHLLRLDNFVFIRHNINEPINLEEVSELAKFKINLAGIDYVYNLACPTSPKNFEEHRLETVLTNCLGTKNSLDLAMKYQAKYLLASSSVIYGGAEEGREIFQEDDLGCVETIGPRSCYDEGKRFAETLTITYRDKFKLDVKIARIFRTYGPRMRLNDGQMVPDFITDALDNKDLVIYGDKNFASSFCYVSDIVDGLIKLMESNLDKPVNLGSADNYLIADIANQIIDMVQSKSKIKYDPPLLFMRPLGLPDISFAKQELNWFPIVTINEGLKSTIEYTLAEKELIRFSS